MKKLDTKLIDKICAKKGDILPILCFKNTFSDDERLKTKVINILLDNGYPIRYTTESYLRNDVFIALQALEDIDEIIKVDYVSNYVMFEKIKQATLTAPVKCYNYLLYACDRIENLMINDEELE